MTAISDTSWQVAITLLIPLLFFLFFNFSTFKLPKLFLGDSGSLLIGFIIAFTLIFIGNSGDQLDCDFCNGQLKKNYFEGSAKVKLIGDGTDGLDLSGSKLQVSDNIFLNLTDKAISIGEQSEVKLLKNSISYSNIGIAVKDGSIATLIENKFTNNQLDVTTYIKKKMYLMPKVLYADASESVL